MKQNIGIIGGAGFIGKNLTDFFIEEGHNVTVIGRNMHSSKYKNPGIIPIQVESNNTDQLLKSVQSCEVIIWLVSASVPSTSNESLVDDFSININPLIKFLERTNELPKFKKFIYLSSGGTIYGDSLENKPLDENSSKRPISAYGLSKIVAENYIKFLTNNSRIQSFILRPSNVYGMYQNLLKPQGIIGFTFKSIINNTSIDLYDQGRVTRDFIYVTDLARAVYCCVNSEYKESSTSIYNVGSQQGYTIKEVLDKINIIAKKSIHIIPKS
jgi:UDP-glucose 4-epimerase